MTAPSGDSAFDVQAVKTAAGGLADVVLVDAPCSSLGTLRRGANVRWELAPDAELSTQFPQLQRAVLESAAELVAVGGVLVYSTCTTVDQENWQVAQAFSQAHADTFEPSRLSESWGDELARAVCNASGWATQTSVQLLPHKHQTDGFFIARWRRIKSN